MLDLTALEGVVCSRGMSSTDAEFRIALPTELQHLRSHIIAKFTERYPGSSVRFTLMDSLQFPKLMSVVKVGSEANDRDDVFAASAGSFLSSITRREE